MTAQPEQTTPELPETAGLVHLADDHPAKIAPLLEGLRDADMPFVLVTDGGTGSVDSHRGSAGWKAKASVFVEPSDRERAERLYRDFLAALIPHLNAMTAAHAPPADSCPGCHETLSESVDECPSCGLVFLDS